MATTNMVPTSFPISAARLKGRIRGALICGFFGTPWMLYALYFGGIATPASLTIVALCAVALIAWPVIRLRSLRHLRYSPADRQYWATISTIYWADFIIEWLACSVAAIWLTHIRRFDLFPQFFGVIIGLHFLPLGKIFKLPIYYATGIVMALGVLAALMIPAGHVRYIAANSALGLSLWATAAAQLCEDWLSSREKEVIAFAG
jgi:hypothetical protein